MLEPTALSVSRRLLSVRVHHKHAMSAIFITLTPYGYERCTENARRVAPRRCRYEVDAMQYRSRSEAALSCFGALDIVDSCTTCSMLACASSAVTSAHEAICIGRVSAPEAAQKSRR